MTERRPAETTGDLSAVLAFAWSPAAYMDASWWEDWLPPSLFERLRENPRSRSARLRAAERVGEPGG